MNSRNKARRTAEAYLDSGKFEADLAELVAIPTESQKPEGQPHCLRYLDRAMTPRLAALGFECRVFENPIAGQGPVLLASRIENDTRPTVLGYGHGDVIRGQTGQWSDGGDPWTLRREGDRLYGRGTADNKGQHLINIAAMEAVIATRGHLGFNAKILIETGEETGSLGLHEIISANSEAFGADVFIASDGPRVTPDRPTVSLGCRGAQNFDLVCDLRQGAHHSGNWGGALADPAMILSHALACIATQNGEILVPEWRPPPLRDIARQLLADITLDGGSDAPAIDVDWGEPGLSTVERVYGWNSFAVLAMTSGNPDAPVNAIAPRASAHCQLRFVKGTDVDDILPALRRHLDAHGFAQVQIATNPDNDGGFGASRTEPDTPWVLKIRHSLALSTGEEPAVIPQMGGSICNELFTDLLNVPAIWIPHSYTGCSQHAPDEHVLLPLCRSALSIMAGLYWDIGTEEFQT